MRYRQDDIDAIHHSVAERSGREHQLLVRSAFAQGGVFAGEFELEVALSLGAGVFGNEWGGRRVRPVD